MADKGVLRDTRVLSLVEKWAQCVPDKTNIASVESSAPAASVAIVTQQPPDSTDTSSNSVLPGGDGDRSAGGDVADTGSSCDDKVTEAVPLKKRRMLSAVTGGGDDMSSSDSDVTENVVQSTSDCVVRSADAESNASVTDLSVSGTDQHASDNSNSSMSEVQGLAADLLSAWKSLQASVYM